MIRVAFVIGGLEIGGTERQLLHLLRALNPGRVAPIVVSLRAGGRLVPLLAEAGVDVIEIGYRGGFDARVVFALRRMLLKRQVAVCCLLLWPATLWGYLALRMAGITRWIASERGTEYATTTIRARLYVWVESWIMSRASAVVANSLAGREYSIARGVSPERVRVIRNGLPPLRPPRTDPRRMREDLRIEAGAPVIGTIASFTAKKDHHTLMLAAVRILEKRPDAHFVLVGDGVLRRETECFAAELGISRQVHFVGIQLHTEDWLNLFDVALLPSCEREGCSNFLLEAAAMRKPMVATDVGGNGEIVRQGDTGLLVASRAPEAMADAVLRVLDEQGLGSQLGTSAAALVERSFTVQSLAECWEELILAVARGNSSSAVC